MDQPTTDPLLAALDRFVGQWTVTAGPPGGPPWPGESRVRFEWLGGDGGGQGSASAFLVERWAIDSPGLPEGTPTRGTNVYGCDADHGTYVQLYADDRGVTRVYAMGLRENEWTLRREGPPFAQRFTGTFAAGGRTITGRWEIQEPGEDWRVDFDVTYTRTR